MKVIFYGQLTDKNSKEDVVRAHVSNELESDRVIKLYDVILDRYYL